MKQSRKDMHPLLFDTILTDKQRDKVYKFYSEMTSKHSKIEKELNSAQLQLQTLKEAVREWLKAGDDFATNKINEDKYDKAFSKLKELIK